MTAPTQKQIPYVCVSKDILWVQSIYWLTTKPRKQQVDHNCTFTLSIQIIGLQVGSNFCLPFISIAEQFLLVVQQLLSSFCRKLKVGALQQSHIGTTWVWWQKFYLCNHQPMPQQSNTLLKYDVDTELPTFVFYIIIIKIIIIALKGAIQDLLQSPHCAANRLQHIHSSGLDATMCKSHATHRLSRVTCDSCHMVQRDSSAIKFELKSHLF